MNRFKNHILKEVHLKTGIYNMDIWDFKSSKSEYTDRLRFINSCGTMTVNGDFGNWIFCREFNPSKDGKVSRGYWDEKLRIGSKQNSHEFDSEETLELINNMAEEWDREGHVTEELSEWFDNLRENAYDKIDYENIAYRQTPSDFDWEYIPYGEKRHVWLDIIYDAFDEICTRYE